MRPTEPIPSAVLLETAAELFATHGYAATSMRKLAGALSITPAALYHHYPSKDALYDAVMQATFRAPAEPMAALLAAPGPDDHKLRALIGLGAQMIETHPVGVRLLRRELMENDPSRLHRLLDENFNTPINLMIGFIGDMFPGHDPIIVTGAIGSLLLGFYELRPIHKSVTGGAASPPSPDQVTETVFTLVTNGFPTKKFQQKASRT